MQSIIFLANGVVVNINQKIKIKKKSFAGINVNGYCIKTPEEYKMETFDDNEIYESAIMCKTQFQNIIDKIKNDHIEIVSLIGNNDIISEKEYIALQ